MGSADLFRDSPVAPNKISRLRVGSTAKSDLISASLEDAVARTGVHEVFRNLAERPSHLSGEIQHQDAEIEGQFLVQLVEEIRADMEQRGRAMGSPASEAPKKPDHRHIADLFAEDDREDEHFFIAMHPETVELALQHDEEALRIVHLLPI